MVHVLLNFKRFLIFLNHTFPFPKKPLTADMQILSISNQEHLVLSNDGINTNPRGSINTKRSINTMFVLTWRAQLFTPPAAAYFL